MILVWSLVALVIAILLLERWAITALTSSDKGRAWVIRHQLLHPNSISIIRVPMGVASVLLWIAGWKASSILWFSVWMITDLTDGTIARRCDLTTESGKWLDPLSDKCMYFPALVYFSLHRALDPVWVTALLLIDAVGQASRLFVRKRAANHFGKAKTALITILLALTSLNDLAPMDFISPAFLYLLLVSCTILAFLSFYCKVVPDLWYANSLTLANFCCGLAALHSIFHEHPVRAFVLVFVGQFFDLFDGRLARRFGSTRLGAVYDDIADGTSFGGAIGMLIYHQLGQGTVAGSLAVIYFVCVVYRLVRFLHPPFPLPRGIFLGLPSPAGALLAGSVTLVFASHPWIAGALILLTSLLMVSYVRYRHFGQLIWPSMPNSVKLLGFIVCMVFVDISLANKSYRTAFSSLTLLLASAYLIYGLARFEPRATTPAPAPDTAPANDAATPGTGATDAPKEQG
jgi:CDP-diacylglycerol--serine O-phosphatidyltransferase